MFIRIFWQEAVPCSHKSGLIAVNGYLDFTITALLLFDEVVGNTSIRVLPFFL
jgi:hypothetical protein